MQEKLHTHAHPQLGYSPPSNLFRARLDTWQQEENVLWVHMKQHVH